MRIEAKTIPHSEQRYPTCGDWWFDAEGVLQVRTSDLGDWRKEACILVHEIIETLICKKNGVSQEAVDKFDTEYEKNRPEDDESEPGDDPQAPYYNEHQIATSVERLLAQQLGLNWLKYEEEINRLFNHA